MRVLLDTCVLSKLQRRDANTAIIHAMDALAEEDIFLSVVSVGEIAKGIALLEAGKKQRELLLWLETLEHHYADRLLPVDTDTARIWGELTAAAQKLGRIVQAGDGLIAATAHQHGLHVMTRNIRDFAPMGVLTINPWAG